MSQIEAALANLIRWQELRLKMNCWAGTPEECKEVDALSEHVWSDARAALSQQSPAPSPDERWHEANVRQLEAALTAEQFQAEQRARMTEALEYLFLAILTRADADFLDRAMRRADAALREAMPGWNPPFDWEGQV